MWAADIAQTGTDTKVIDALTWLSRATLDIIGQAGSYLCDYGRLDGCYRVSYVSNHLVLR